MYLGVIGGDISTGGFIRGIYLVGYTERGYNWRGH